MPEPNERYGWSTVIIIGLTVIAVPLIMTLVFVTDGAIEPSLAGQRNTWNIQYCLHLSTAVLAGSCAFVCRKSIGKFWWAIVGWNALFGVLAIYAVLSLWGEKY